uniref:Copper transport protein n=1 Tax=Meloidogyne incognita TaxID=6306 RepID=A0A914KMJ6_MELIC
MMPMMQMYFHFRENEYLLFKGILPNNLTAYLFSLLFVLVLSIVYEAIRIFRALLYRSEEGKQNCLANSENTNQINNQQCECSPPPQLLYQALIFSDSSSLFSSWHLTQTILHFTQSLIGFCLMLLAMTYNVPVFIFLLLGHIFGYFLFGPLYQHGLVEENRVGGDCCCS